MTVVRTIIELPVEQLDALDRWRRREGVSRAEAIRRAVALLIEAQGAADRREAFGMWANRPVDGLAYEAAIRTEWSQRKLMGASRRR